MYKILVLLTAAYLALMWLLGAALASPFVAYEWTANKVQRGVRAMRTWGQA